MQISTYEDALQYMSPEARLEDTWEYLKNTNSETPEYTALAKIRLQAKREIMGVSKRMPEDAFSGFRAQLYSEETA